MSQHDWDGKGQRHVWRKQWADPAVVILRGARRRASGCRLTSASHQKIWTKWGRLTEGPCQRPCSALFIVPANTFAVSEKIDRKKLQREFPSHDCIWKKKLKKKGKKRYQRCYPVFAWHVESKTKPSPRGTVHVSHPHLLKIPSKTPWKGISWTG